MTRVFVCYSRQDSIFVDEMINDLKSFGIPTWRDLDNVPAHIESNTVSWRRAIQAGLMQSSHMIVVISPDSITSKEVEAEWHFFLSLDRPVYPVVYRECNIPYRLYVLNRIDFYIDYERGIEKLAQLIDQESGLEFIGKETSPAKEVSESTKPVTPTPHSSSVRIVVDTSFLMMEQAESCIEQELKSLIFASGKRLAVPIQVVRELDSMQESNDKERATKSKRALSLLRDYQNIWFDFFGEDSDATYADHLFNAVFLRYSVDTNLILLTQDRALAHDILLIREFRSFRCKPPLAIRMVHRNGKIESWNRNAEGEIQTQNKRIPFACPDCGWQSSFNQVFIRYLQSCGVPLCPTCTEQEALLLFETIQS